ncbi:MAG: MoxR family ATPase [Actinomycetota bacterium]
MTANVELLIKGKSAEVRQALVCLMAEGHLLIDDVPGVGKTSLGRAISNSISGTMSRIQFTPDLLPTDVSGVHIYNTGERRFEFHMGPVFANIVMADEINRASPKTQSALLEVMEEQQVTADGQTFTVPRPFMVIATQNPIELDGTYHLPEAQVDRFMMRMELGYPSHDAQVELLDLRARGVSVDQIQPVLDVAEVQEMIDTARQVDVAKSLLEYVSTLITHTRSMEQLRLGVSPRGGLALVRACQSLAAANGRTFVVVDDVKQLAAPVLGHRMLLTPDSELEGVTAEQLINSTVAVVPVPQERVG